MATKTSTPPHQPSATDPVLVGEQQRLERLLLAAMSLCALIGIGVSTYLTTLHYAKIVPVCTAGGVINCAKVTQSAYSVVGNTNVPITVPGMGWFIVSGILAGWGLMGLRGRVDAPDWLPAVHALWGAFGLAFILYLIYVEFGILHAVCEWCSGVHILVILTFLLALVRWQRSAAARYAAD